MPRSLWNPTVRYLVHNSPPLIPSWVKQSQTTPAQSHFFTVLEAYPHLRLSLQRGLFPSRSSIKLLHTQLLHACHIYRLFNRPCRRSNEMYNTRPFLIQLLLHSVIISMEKGDEIESHSSY